MKTSSAKSVREFYDISADTYSDMMDSEINLPVYADTLGRLAERIVNVPGPIVDTSCGSGHMLSKYREHYDPQRPLIGVDLSPRMVSIARSRLNDAAEILNGDMRDLVGIEPGSTAAVLSFFALHHLNPAEVVLAFKEWRRILRPGGQLIVAAWEGSGPIDYGDASDIAALRYTQNEISDWAKEAKFIVDRCNVEPVEEFPMHAIYLEGSKA